MTRHRQINVALALLMAAIAVLGPIVMDGPTELDAIRDTQASVLDAQAAATQSPTFAIEDTP